MSSDSYTRTFARKTYSCSRTQGKNHCQLGDETIERNLYRHPSRQGAIPADEFIMQHDIYNLGVCLLEIGLWESFVTYDSNDSNATLSSMFGFPSTISKEEMMTSSYHLPKIIFSHSREVHFASLWEPSTKTE
ncbi:hypothetical protein HYALB_00001616 [Hymenoscyphus albidus]|uniref:Uncharacterized protein n=1 Tax=Hymenoscyphus albidus TaxID=595503 RepID=A0A9N9PQ20_9HELO|nr:hypothetical protein HYALB_00001616 [Hymenoscyphus albidus]